MSQTLEEEVNHPVHYNNHPSGIQAIEITRWLGFDLGNAWKYLMRYKSKKYDVKSTEQKDLKKVIWYINDFKNNFIDPYTNEINSERIKFNLPEHIGMMMWLVYESEEASAIKDMFLEIIDITTNNGLVNPLRLKDRLTMLQEYAETFSA